MKLNFPHIEPHEMGASCVLDVADQHGVSLELTGELINLTRERVRQLEVRGLLKVKMTHTPDLEPIAVEGEAAS